MQMNLYETSLILSFKREWMERDDISLQMQGFQGICMRKGRERVICYLSALYDTEMQSVVGHVKSNC